MSAYSPGSSTGAFSRLWAWHVWCLIDTLLIAATRMIVASHRRRGVSLCDARLSPELLSSSSLECKRHPLARAIIISSTTEHEAHSKKVAVEMVSNSRWRGNELSRVQVHVRLVDYGRSVWAPIDYIYALPLTLGRYPVIAVHCRTQGLCGNVFCGC